MIITGLILIVVGWLVQLYRVFAGAKQISRGFLVLYIIGVLLLVIDAFREGLGASAWLNLIALVISFLVLYKAMDRKSN